MSQSRRFALEFLKLCCLAPHPPIIIPEVGGSELKKIQGSVNALEKLGDIIKHIAPETLVVMSPHTPIYRSTFSIMTGNKLSGSFYEFRAPQVEIQSTPDNELARALMEIASREGIPLVESGGETMRGAGWLDHGIMVPLYYLAPDSYQLACLTISMLDYRMHYRLGTAIREAVEASGRNTVFIASGDLSHRLKPGAPAGYNPRGEEFDHAIGDIMSSGRFEDLFDLDPVLVEEAGECGLRSIFTLAGVVDGYSVDSHVLSYEGPFGVGYMVAQVSPLVSDPARRLSPP